MGRHFFSNFFEGLKKNYHYSEKTFSTKRKKIVKPMKNKFGRLQTAKSFIHFFPTPFASTSMKPMPNEVLCQYEENFMMACLLGRA